LASLKVVYLESERAVSSVEKMEVPSVARKALD
jgi:hypothetical protein